MLARIVVIEDDVYMREELIDMLKKAGYDAVPLPAFENAVSQLAELSPDLILLDINLPFRSGFEICAASIYHEPNWQIVQKTRGRLPKSVEKSSGISPLGV